MSPGIWTVWGRLIVHMMLQYMMLQHMLPLLLLRDNEVSLFYNCYHTICVTAGSGMRGKLSV